MHTNQNEGLEYAVIFLFFVFEALSQLLFDRGRL